MVMTVFSGLKRAAGELVRLGDPQHFLHAVEHLDQRGVELPVAADRADHGPQRAGRPVHVEAHLHELRDHAAAPARRSRVPA